ncbi:hypothetical protein DOE51_10345 [Bdellovibrio sp. NC01]|nr:hypothetical protein DOE51_10345 [Bdellovibrio sp. NC01]
MRYEFSTSINKGLRIFGFLLSIAIVSILAIHCVQSEKYLGAVIFFLLIIPGIFEIKKLIVDNRTLILFDNYLEYSIFNGSHAKKFEIPFSDIQSIRKSKLGAPFFIVLKNGMEIFFSYNFKLNSSSLNDDEVALIRKLGGTTYLQNIVFLKAILESKINK